MFWLEDHIALQQNNEVLFLVKDLPLIQSSQHLTLAPSLVKDHRWILGIVLCISQVHPGNKSHIRYSNRDFNVKNR